MLQPRIPLRQICVRCQTFGSLFRRSYAQVAEPIATTETTSTTPIYQSPNTPVQSSGEAALRRYTPRTPGVRHLVRPRNDHLWKGRPLKSLTYPKKGHARGGRNKTGRITVRHRGGGVKRRIRTVDFTRADPGKHFVERIEHDPNRSAHIALIKNFDTGKQSYILAAEGMRAGDVVESFRSGLPQDLLESIDPNRGEDRKGRKPKAKSQNVDMGVLASRTAWRGNCLKLSMIPVGTPIFNIAPRADTYGKFARSAGTHGIIIGKGEDSVQKEMLKAVGEEGSLDLANLSSEQLRRFEKAANYVTIRLSSGEIRLFDKEAVATIGVASNINFKYTSLGKAGRKRWLGIRPTVRGTAMNTVDHPHGGGRGKSKGNKIPVSPWGVPTKSGYKTRSKDKDSRLIVQGRPRNQGKRRKHA